MKITTNPAYLKCTECGNKATIQRKSFKSKKNGHIKHIWCYKCKERTAHIEMTEFECDTVQNF